MDDFAVMQRHHQATSDGVRWRDDLLPTDLLSELYAFFRQPIWSFGWKSKQDNDEFPFWHVHIAGGGRKSFLSCEEQLNSRSAFAPIARTWEFLKNEVLPDQIPVRIYANGHTFGVEGTIHQDHDDPTFFTTIIYAHSDWDAQWGGETIFLDKSREHILASVHPRPGRLVVFPGNLPHCARAPSRVCPALRVTLVVKSRLLPSNLKE